MSKSKRTQRPGSGEAWPLGQAGPSPRPAAARQQYTEPERAELLSRWESSGLTAAAFAAQQGMSSVSVLYGWRSAAKRGRAGPSTKSARNPLGKTRGAYSEAERVAAVSAYRNSNLTQRAFAKTWGLSMKTLSVWVRRAEREGEKGLATKTRGRPPGSINRRTLPAAVQSAIVETKQLFPDFGLKKVAQHLLRFAGLRVSPGSVRNTLRRAGVAQVAPPPVRKRAKPLPRRFERARPNQLWQTDITSLVLPRHGARVYLTVFLDDHSRYVVSWALASQQKSELVIGALRDGIGRFGKPEEVLSDQGRQYFAWRGKSSFQKELRKLGIAHVVARAHHPETVGKCERLWETVQRELWSRCMPVDLAEARERLGHFFAHYNHLRPHQGIEGAVPADRFFGAGDAVRAQLEANVSRNELQLAIGEVPRQPVYLVGQVGEQAISVHGERGKLVVVTPSGRQELSFEELGAASSAPQHTEVSDGRRGEAELAAAAVGPDGQASALCAAEGGAAGAGSVGSGEQRGEGEGAPAVRGDPGVVGGTTEPGGGGTGAGTEQLTGVAIESVGIEWDAGGPAEATEATREGGDEGSLGRSESGCECAAQGAGGGAAQERDPGAAGEAAAGAAGGQGPNAAGGEGTGPAGGDPASGGKKGADATSGCGSP